MPEVPSLALPQTPGWPVTPGTAAPCPLVVHVIFGGREEQGSGEPSGRRPPVLPGSGAGGRCSGETGTPLPGMRGDRKCCQPAVPPLGGRLVTSPCRSTGACLPPGLRGRLGRGWELPRFCARTAGPQVARAGPAWGQVCRRGQSLMPPLPRALASAQFTG